MNHSFDIEHAKTFGVTEAIFISNFEFWLAIIGTDILIALGDGQNFVAQAGFPTLDGRNLLPFVAASDKRHNQHANDPQQQN